MGKNNKNKKKKISIGDIATLLVGCFMAGGVIVAMVLTMSTGFASSELNSMTPNSVISIDMQEDVLVAEPKVLSTILNRYGVSYKVPTHENTLFGSFDVFDDYVYVETYAEDGTSANVVYISSSVADAGDFTADEVSKMYGAKGFSTTTKESVEDEIERFQTLSSLYRSGYMWTEQRLSLAEGVEGSINKITFDGEVLRNVSFSKSKNTTKVLNINGLGDLVLNDVKGVSTKFGVFYDINYNWVTVYDETAQTSVLIICQMYHENLGNMVEELIPTKYTNLYIDAEFLDNTGYGYGGFAIQTENGMYYFKVGEAVDNIEGFVQSIIDQFGLSENDERIPNDVDLTLTYESLTHLNKEE